MKGRAGKRLTFLGFAAAALAGCGGDDEAAQAVGRARFQAVEKVYQQRIAEDIRKVEASRADAELTPSPLRSPSPSPSAGPIVPLPFMPTPPMPEALEPDGGFATPLLHPAGGAGEDPGLASPLPLALAQGAGRTPLPGGAAAPHTPLRTPRPTSTPGPRATVTPPAANIRDLRLGFTPPPGLVRGGDAAGADPGAESTSTPAATPTPDSPEADSQAPQLLSVSFVPAQVHDGSEARIVVTASDNLSGIDTGSGSLMSPSGKVFIPFSLASEAPSLISGNLGGSFKVPPEAEAGSWRLSSLRLVDKAQNTSVLSSRDNAIVGAAQLTVSSSKNDTDAPVLESVELQPSQVEDGGTVNVFIRASDEKSTVATVRGILANPSRTVQLNFYPKLNPAAGRFEGQVKLPLHSEFGEWQVTLVTLTDSAGNRGTTSADDEKLKSVKVAVVSSSSDTTAPQLLSIRFDPPRVPNNIEKGSAVEITVVANDDLSGVKSVDGWVVSPNAQARRAFTLRATGTTGEFKGQTDIPFKAAAGAWRTERLTLADNAGNRAILNSTSDPTLQTAVIEVYVP